MKKWMLFFLLVGGSVLAQDREVRQVDDFSTVRSSQAIVVNFTYGGKKNVLVEVEKAEVLRDVKTEVKDGQLHLYIENNKSKSGNWFFNSTDYGKVTVTINNPTLEGVILSSSSRFNLQNTVKAKNFAIKTSSSAKFNGEEVKTDNLTMEASSSSRIEGDFTVNNMAYVDASSSAVIDVNVKTKRANFTASSSARIEIAGSTEELDASVSSSASLKGGDFIAARLDGKASSSGSMLFHVTDEVNAKASSSGKLSYKGKATLVNAKESSSGHIRHVN